MAIRRGLKLVAAGFSLRLHRQDACATKDFQDTRLLFNYIYL